jgi:hypothetical protein
VLHEAQAVALNPLHKLKRPGPDHPGGRFGAFSGLSVDDVEVFEEVEGGRARLVRFQDDGVLVRRLDLRPPLALVDQRA